VIAYTLSALLAVLLMFGPAVLWVWLRKGGHRAAVARLRATRVLATSPDPCRACGARNGWHDQGCGILDRLDHGQVPA
jgi:hypothetical protein